MSRRSRRSRGGLGGAKASIDMNSLIDLTFLLLVTFMLTIPALEQGISIMLPRAKADTLPSKNAKANTITLDVNQRVYLNNVPKSLEELEAELQKTNTPFEEWRNTIREDLVLGGMRYQIIDKYIQVSPAAMRKEYEEHRNRYREESKTSVRVILLKPAAEGQPSVQDRAKTILAKLAEPNADFAALAREYSADSHAKDGGLWKDIKPEEAFRAEIADEIAVLKPGEHSQLVNLDGWGFIVKKENAVTARDYSFEEAYDMIVRNVRRAETAKAYAAWMKRLRANAFITIYPMPEK